MINPAYEIERLLQFGEKHGMISKLDKIIARNQLLDLLKLNEPFYGEIPDEYIEFPTEILERIVDYAGEAGLFDKDIYACRELFDTKVMGLMMPRESEIIRKFTDLAEKQSIKAATDYFYNLCIASNYIRTSQIAKNIKWTSDSKYGQLEITINLTKPEKDPKTIAMERMQPKSNYPECMLCIDNIGYAGRINFPPRQTHRLMPVTLCGEQWYLQYSPYVYYNEHCIVLSEKHVPMVISKSTFRQLLDFVRQFPHYICGSNADLPIVGGSILSHNHFQGGNYLFPMLKAPVIAKYKSQEFRNVDIGLVKWPLSVIRLSCESMDDLVEFSDYVLTCWKGYSDETSDVFAYTDTEKDRVPHNTITPIVRINETGKYELNLVLRNNRTTEEHPDGIFHPHKEIHHIKKENIGLIEVMGLAILPGRLKNEIIKIKEILIGNSDTAGIYDSENVLYKHKNWIEELISKYGTALTNDSADRVLRNEIGKKFEICLEHTGVFKQDNKGLEAFDRFLKSMGWELIQEQREITS
ncbi:UDP-glucose--hexose-1-phosphate uridylyltransferase [Ruminiclostridium cellulolyticum]|uniref:Galactose-1-phosphate uridylyltransferase n=1 Tax=Ruminiclostridium cellulolyticum (strain ATCC 35319 / DSM 5812 / JCM 6584 / H10) TaxID=394503 RepID=B8I4V5_RUMCH|nr:UDP-glucose--hexose-1-phosphate uridylyltransferase [Ruminiclostridium cellulolyticum]ACL76609.1 galactose-1-phosphate uridyl transferase domain protein [Ruminiclostridium cellulolyticum H10]